MRPATGSLLESVRGILRGGELDSDRWVSDRAAIGQTHRGARKCECVQVGGFRCPAMSDIRGANEFAAGVFEHRSADA